MAIKLILFDGFGVVLEGGYMQTAELLTKYCDKSKEQIFDIIYKKYFNMAAERKITQKQAWQGPVKELGLSIPWQKVRELHYSIKRLNKKIIPLMKKLRKYTKIVLLSKSTRSQFTDDENNLHFKQYFDDTINTWELGIPKASKKTFLYIMKKYNVKPKEIIQIDDQEQNLIESAKLGIYTILFKNEKDLEKKISSIIDIS